VKRVTVALSVLALAIAWASGCSDDAAPSASAGDAGPPPAVPRPSTNDPQILAGWQAVLNRGCPACHQSPDASDGILSGAIAPQPGTMEWPKNLTPDPDTGIDAWDAATMTTALRTGVDDEGTQLCPTMPHFGDMKDDEALAIAAYLQSLEAVHHYVPESLCPPIKSGEDDAGSGDDGASDAGIDDAPSDG
jgi:hypothetical protein